MGWPVNVVIAEIVMQKSRRNDYVKSRKLSRILVSICRCRVKEDQVQHVLREINSINHDLQFTLE